jgi:hypothetical protein
VKGLFTVLIILAQLVFSNKIGAQSVTLPSSPQKSVDITMPTQGTSNCPTLTTGSNCIRMVSAGSAANLQKAISAATCGDTIVLAAGSTYSGTFTIPSTSCSGWIEIASSGLSSLPSPGNRVGPSNVNSMATISTPSTATAIQFLPGANHWRLMGLEITTSFVSTTNPVYQLVSAGNQSDGATGLTVQSQLPAFLIFDRVYIHGLPSTNTNHAIQMDAQSIAVVDSYCDEIHNNGADSQCFVSWNGSGPFLIQNNFVQAGAEDILFGGADPSIPNLVPSDITIVGNLIQKNLNWRGAGAPYNWVIKNLIELKNAQRVLIDGNVIQNIWTSGQFGFAVLLTPRNQSQHCSWCSVNDVTITHNLIQHSCGGTEIAGADNEWFPIVSLPSARVLVQNNVYGDISGANWCSGGGGWVFEIAMNSQVATPHDLILNHNTAFTDNRFLQLGDSGTAARTQITNNLSDYGAYGISGTGAGVGSTALSAFLPGVAYSDMVFITPSGSSDGNAWPVGTLWGTQNGVQFTAFSSGDFQLLSSSPYHAAGTDGKDIGVADWTCLNSYTAAALAGNYVSSAVCASTPSLRPQPPMDLTVTVR